MFFQYEVGLNTETNSRNETYFCSRWNVNSNSWDDSDDSCSVASVETKDLYNYITCSCSKTGYFTITSVSDIECFDLNIRVLFFHCIGLYCNFLDSFILKRTVHLAFVVCTGLNSNVLKLKEKRKICCKIFIYFSATNISCSKYVKMTFIFYIE